MNNFDSPYIKAANTTNKVLQWAGKTVSWNHIINPDALKYNELINSLNKILKEHDYAVKYEVNKFIVFNIINNETMYVAFTVDQLHDNISDLLSK